MKTTSLTLLTGLALAASAQAGPTPIYSSKGKEIIPPPPEPCLWSWFAGGSVGYIGGDWEEEIYNLHIGAEYKCPTSSCSHSIFLEVGYTEQDETVSIIDPNATAAIIFADHDVSLEVIPITLNYKYECAINSKLNWYIGGGAGVALVDFEIDGPFVDGSESDTVFYAHIFAGLTYDISESFEIFGGARYIFMDEIDDTDEGILDEEIQYELGVRFNF